MDDPFGGKVVPLRTDLRGHARLPLEAQMSVKSLNPYEKRRLALGPAYRHELASLIARLGEDLTRDGHRRHCVWPARVES